MDRFEPPAADPPHARAGRRTVRGGVEGSVLGSEFPTGQTALPEMEGVLGVRRYLHSTQKLIRGDVDREGWRFRSDLPTWSLR